MYAKNHSKTDHILVISWYLLGQTIKNNTAIESYMHGDPIMFHQVKSYQKYCCLGLGTLLKKSRFLPPFEDLEYRQSSFISGHFVLSAWILFFLYPDIWIFIQYPYNIFNLGKSYARVGCTWTPVLPYTHTLEGENLVKLKPNRPHLRDYLHMPTDYRHTDNHFRLVMLVVALCLCIGQCSEHVAFSTLSHRYFIKHVLLGWSCKEQILRCTMRNLRGCFRMLTPL